MDRREHSIRPRPGGSTVDAPGPASGPLIDGLLAGIGSPLDRLGAAADLLRARPWRAGAAGLLLAVVIAGGWWLGRPAEARSLDDAIPFAPGASVPASRSGSSSGSGGPPGTAVAASGPAGGPASTAGTDRAAAAGPASPAAGPGAATGGTSSGTGGEPAAPLVVHVAGAVQVPGIVSLAPGQRVIDALQAAGGAAPDADLDQLNLAAPVADGMQVRVPRRGEVVTGPVGPSPSPSPSGGGAGPTGAAGPVNLNQASAQQLDQLPGIGPSLAAAIVTYRQQHGRFNRVEDLLNVQGIGPAKLADLTGHVSV